MERGHTIGKLLLWGLLLFALLSFAEPSPRATATEDFSVTLATGVEPLVAPASTSNWHSVMHPSPGIDLKRYYPRTIDYPARITELRSLFAEDTSNEHTLFRTINDFENLSPRNLGEALEAYTSVEENKAKKAHDYRTTDLGTTSFDKTDANYKRIYQACLLAMEIDERLVFPRSDAGTCRIMAHEAASLKSLQGIDSF